MFTHRSFEIKDANIICELCQSAEELFFAFPEAIYPLMPEALIASIHQRFCPTVALHDELVVGYTNFVKVREKGFCVIGNLMVHPKYRRKGIATYLVKTMIRKAFEAHCSRFVRVACFSHNQAAYQLFHRLGFKPAEMEHRITADGNPILVVNLYLHRRKVSCDNDVFLLSQ